MFISLAVNILSYPMVTVLASVVGCNTSSIGWLMQQTIGSFVDAVGFLLGNN
jgi:hypothetical protein